MSAEKAVRVFLNQDIQLKIHGILENDKNWKYKGKYKVVPVL
jgi:hypothetical protein